MKLRFFALDSKSNQPIPGCVVSASIIAEIPQRAASADDAQPVAETEASAETAPKRGKSSSAALLKREKLGPQASTELRTFNFQLSSTRTDHCGYGRIDLAKLNGMVKSTFEFLLVHRMTEGKADLVLEIDGSPMSRISISQLEEMAREDGVGQEAASSGLSTEQLAKLILAMFGERNDAMILRGDQNSNCGPTGHVADPDTLDYELSPDSFVSRRAVKTGGDGCEHLTPATLPLRQYPLYHVVVHDTGPPKGSNAPLPSVQPVVTTIDNRILWGQILEFEQSWTSLGHSLGEVKYSLALAPGEAVKIAVIDWKRDDTGSRLGANASKDALLHDQTVDRDVDDIVSGKVAEKQSGESFMAGLAGAMDFSMPQIGISAAGRHSVGYGTSNTKGNRSVASEAHQNVHLQTLQRSNLARSQNSSVIVQATQAESNYLSTRIVANMNRGHSLTILYYEVLRHLAVKTKFRRADPAVLIPVDILNQFDGDTAMRFRTQIEPVLLDEKYRAGFDALERLAAGIADETDEVVETPVIPKIGPTPTVETTAVFTSRFSIEFKTGWRWNAAAKDYKAPADTAGDIRVIARMTDGTTKTLVDSGFVSLEKFRTLSLVPPEVSGWTIRYEEDDGWCFATVAANVSPIDLRKITGFAISWRPIQIPTPPLDPVARIAHDVARGADGWNLNEAKITAELSSGPLLVGNFKYTASTEERFGSRNNDDFVEQGVTIINLDKLPTSQPSAVLPPPTSESSTTVKPKGIPSTQLAKMLINHLNSNFFYYGANIWLTMDSRERKRLIAPFAGPLLAGMSDMPFAMTGNHLAFRYSGDLPPEAKAVLPPSASDITARNALEEELVTRENIITLPTRGIFAEAHLGNCNAAEKRDITRLWNFDELPVSLLPNIETLTMGPKGSYQSLSPDQMGSSPLGIQATPNLPTPGEAAAKAFELLGKSEIFRDMSARKELADIMGKLIDSAQPPKMTGGNVGSALPGGSNSGSSDSKTPTKTSSSSGSGSMRRSPTERFDDKTVDKEVLDQARVFGVSEGQLADLGNTSSSRLLASSEAEAFPVGGTVGASPAGQIQFADYSPQGRSERSKPGVLGKGIETVAYWRDLIEFAPDPSIITALASRDMQLHRLGDAYGEVNLDLFTVIIDELPDNPAGGKYTYRTLFDHVRENFWDFLQPFYRAGVPRSLEAYGSADATKWDSSTPVGAVLRFLIDANPTSALGSIADALPVVRDIRSVPMVDNALVVCSDYQIDQPNETYYWKFSTVKELGVLGAHGHPVSGTREFGIMRNGAGQHMFAIRAADRTTTFFESAAAPMVFAGADEYWDYFQKALIKYCEENNGSARVGAARSRRYPNWEVREYLRLNPLPQTA